MRDKVWEGLMIVLGIIAVAVIMVSVFVFSKSQVIDCGKYETMVNNNNYVPAYEQCNKGE